jgi:restriction endonuclease S subunit
MQNITKPALLDVEFPLPPIATQRKLAAELMKARATAAAARQRAAELRAQSARHIEEQILGA